MKNFESKQPGGLMAEAQTRQWWNLQAIPGHTVGFPNLGVARGVSMGGGGQELGAGLSLCQVPAEGSATQEDEGPFPGLPGSGVT